MTIETLDVFGKGGIELRDLRMLLTVSEMTSVRRAALSLNLQASAVSRRLGLLEDRLGTSLFERHHNGVRITNVGSAFINDVRSVMARLEAAVGAAASGGRAGNGQIEIGITASLSSDGLNRLLLVFCAEHPDVRRGLFEGDYHDHFACLSARSRDVAFLPGKPDPRGFKSELVWSEPIFAVIPSDDPRATRQVLPLASLADDQFIVAQDPSGPEVHDFIVRRLSDQSFHPKITRHRVGREALMTMVGLGFGTTLVCASDLPAEYRNVSFVAIEGESVPHSAVWSEQNDNPALRRFLSLARRLARERRRFDAVERTHDPST